MQNKQTYHVLNYYLQTWTITGPKQEEFVCNLMIQCQFTRLCATAMVKPRNSLLKQKKSLKTMQNKQA